MARRRRGAAVGGADQQIYRDVDTLNNKLTAEGAMVFGAGLHTPDTATVVQPKGGDILTTDGPFAEAKEQLGGFWIIKAHDLDAALEWARQAAIACQGPVEVRPAREETDA